MPFETLLRASCSNCAESSIRTYTFNIKALAKLAGHSVTPMHSRWLDKALLEKIRKLPLGQFKKFAIAGAKALKAYGKAKKTWTDAVRESGQKYDTQRNKQKRTEREKELWPEGGYTALVKLAEDLHLLHGAHIASACTRRVLRLESGAGARTQASLRS